MRGGTSPGIRGVLVDRGISRGNLEIIEWQRGRAAVEPHWETESPNDATDEAGMEKTGSNERNFEST